MGAIGKLMKATSVFESWVCRTSSHYSSSIFDVFIIQSSYRLPCYDYPLKQPYIIIENCLYILLI